jgi:hypothetical protein
VRLRTRCQGRKLEKLAEYQAKTLLSFPAVILANPLRSLGRSPSLLSETMQNLYQRRFITHQYLLSICRAAKTLISKGRTI